MSRRRLVAVLVVGLVGVPASAFAAAPTLRTLTVRGVPNAYAEVTFAGRVRFETTTKSRPSYDAKGTYAGAYVEPVRGDGPVAGTVLLRAMPSLSDVPFPLGPQGWLPPGGTGYT